MRRSGTDNQDDRSPRADWATVVAVAPRLIRLSLEQRSTLLLGTVALIGGAGINLLFPALIRAFLKGELGWSLERDLLEVTIYLLLLFIVQALFFYYRHLTFSSAGIRIVYRLRKRLFAALMQQEVQYFDHQRSSELLTRLTSDCQLIQNAVSVNISVFLRYAVQVVGGLVMMALVSLKLTAVIAVCVPLFAIGTRLWGAKLQHASRLMQSALGQASVVAGERLSGIRVVKIFRAAGSEVEGYAHELQRAEDAGIARTKIAAQFSSVMVFLLHSSIVIVFFVGARLVMNSELGLGDFAAFLLYSAIVAASFGFLVGVIDDFLLAGAGAARVFEILDRKPQIVWGSKGKESYIPQAPHLKFDRVSFVYSSEPGHVLTVEDISFEVLPGMTVAIVGPSGSGKTTLFSLMTRFYSPLSGEIYYNAVPLSELSESSFMEEFSVVTQQPILFSGTIAQNISYSKPSAKVEEIHRAAEQANLMELIQALPEGLDTQIGENGVKLSGGERQRVTIARAILKNPKLLLLDEATSSLDSRNEALVQQALQSVMKNRTTLIIAHRLSTVQFADLILVMQGGRIVERGNHAGLMADGGLYSSLVQHQLL